MGKGSAQAAQAHGNRPLEIGSVGHANLQTKRYLRDRSATDRVSPFHVTVCATDYTLRARSATVSCCAASERAR